MRFWCFITVKLSFSLHSHWFRNIVTHFLFLHRTLKTKIPSWKLQKIVNPSRKQHFHQMRKAGLVNNYVKKSLSVLKLSNLGFLRAVCEGHSILAATWWFLCEKSLFVVVRNQKKSKVESLEVSFIKCKVANIETESTSKSCPQF